MEISGVWDVRNVLHLDLGGGYKGTHICENSFKCTFRKYASVCDLFPSKKVKEEKK